MRILVTGGTGFVGAHIIPKLVENGYNVFALTRSASSDEKLRVLGATPVRGNLENPEPLSLPSVDAVVHAAAHFRFTGPRTPYFRTNVIGTTALLKAAERAGAMTFVYVSAAGIIMDDRGSPIRNADESAPTFSNNFSAYLASKARGEASVLRRTSPAFARSRFARPRSGG
jgi:nucleoside-diphosphate-sugar epimerase